MDMLFTEGLSMSETSPRAKRAVEALIPRPRVIGGAYHFVEAEAENYLRALAGLDPLPIDANAPVRLIRLSTLGSAPRPLFEDSQAGSGEDLRKDRRHRRTRPAAAGAASQALAESAKSEGWA